MLRRMLATRLAVKSLGLWMALGLLACTPYGEVRQVIRAQFAAELDCRDVQVRKRDVWYSFDSPYQYKVKGCGVLRTYSCPAGQPSTVSYDEPACTWVDGDADAPEPIKLHPLKLHLHHPLKM